jgi:hypothetical protein
VAVLQTIYQDNWNNQSMKQEVLKAIGQTRSAAGSHALKSYYADNWNNYTLRREALSALGHTRTESAVRFLQEKFLEARNDMDRQLILQAITDAYRTDD